MIKDCVKRNILREDGISIQEYFELQIFQVNKRQGTYLLLVSYSPYTQVTCVSTCIYVN